MYIPNFQTSRVLFFKIYFCYIPNNIKIMIEAATNKFKDTQLPSCLKHTDRSEWNNSWFSLWGYFLHWRPIYLTVCDSRANKRSNNITIWERNLSACKSYFACLSPFWAICVISWICILFWNYMLYILISRNSKYLIKL